MPADFLTILDRHVSVTDRLSHDLQLVASCLLSTGEQCSDQTKAKILQRWLNDPVYRRFDQIPSFCPDYSGATFTSILPNKKVGRWPTVLR
jgi:hypothetical protein